MFNNSLLCLVILVKIVCFCEFICVVIEKIKIKFKQVKALPPKSLVTQRVELLKTKFLILATILSFYATNIYFYLKNLEISL